MALKEAYVATVGLQLAYKKVGKGQVPSIQGMMQGMQKLIPGFNLYFARATVDAANPGKIIWPADRTKVGLVETQFDWYEQATSRCLEMIPTISPRIMKLVAPQIWKERNDNSFAFVLPSLEQARAIEPNYNLDGIDRQAMSVWLAGRVVYFATRGITVIRGAGNNLSFNPKTALTLQDVQKFLACELNPMRDIGESEGTEEFDHTSHITGVAPTNPEDDAFWDLGQRIGNRDIFALDEVELDQARMFQNAAASYMSYLTMFDTDNVELKDEIVRQKEQAVQAMDRRAKSEDSIDVLRPRPAAETAHAPAVAEAA